MAKIIDTKPIKHTTGATFMRMGLKISGLNVVSVEPLPLISMKPIITTNMPAARNMKLVLLNARFFCPFCLSLFICGGTHAALSPANGVYIKILFLSYLIQVACLHLKKLVHGKICTKQRDKYSEEENGGSGDCHYLPCDNGYNTRFIGI